VPINRTAKQARVTSSAVDASYRLRVIGPKPYDLDLAALAALPTRHAAYPIACVEGWSASASWLGPPLLDLVRRAGGTSTSRVRVVSLEKGGAYGTSIVEGPHLRTAVLATHLNGQRLSLDHGYPARLIAPDRPGVLNTKWVTEVRVLS
jgi:DMSO/TMAO reductase YedYZ molybdopterin-dependent catalytic subunit